MTVQMNRITKALCFPMMTSALIFGLFNSPQPEYKIVYWSRDVLKWSDFRGSPQKHELIGAITRSGIEYEFVPKAKVVEITINSCFYRNDSWVNMDYVTSKSLEHEQGHFDLTEIYARKLRKYCLDNKINKSSTFKSAIELHNDLLKLVQEEYDKETNFSTDSSGQVAWNSRIFADLEKFGEYSNPIVLIPRAD